MKSYVVVDGRELLLSSVERKNGVPIAGHVINGGWHMRIVGHEVRQAEVAYRKGEDEWDPRAGTPFLSGKTMPLSTTHRPTARTIHEVLVPDAVKGNYQDLMLWAEQQTPTPRRLNGVDQLTLHAIPDTAGPQEVCYAFTEKSFPIFTAPVDLYLEEAVAICLRDADGKPVHGGLLAIAGDEVVGLRLVDEPNGIDVCKTPEWIAIGLNAAMATIRIQSGEKVRELPWSIVDMRVDNERDDLLGPTPARCAAWSTYIERLAPAELLQQGEIESPAL